MSKKPLILFALLFALTAITIGYFIYPEEKEPVTLDFEEGWSIGSYEIEHRGGIPLIEFSYGGFNYTTNLASSQEDSLPKEPIKWSLEKIKLVSANKSVENFQNSFVIQSRVYVLYATVINGEVYYSMPSAYMEQESYAVVSNITDDDMIKISFYPNWVDFWFILIAGSLTISFVVTAIITLRYEQRKKKSIEE